MLTYIFITFPRNVYHSNGFSENSLIYGNVRRTCLFGVSRQGSSDYPAASHPWGKVSIFSTQLAFEPLEVSVAFLMTV